MSELHSASNTKILTNTTASGCPWATYFFVSLVKTLEKIPRASMYDVKGAANIEDPIIVALANLRTEIGGSSDKSWLYSE
jgi:hypothetical protein